MRCRPDLHLIPLESSVPRSRDMTTAEDSSGPSAAPDSGSKPENSTAENGRPESTAGPVPDGMNAQRVFKKASPNQKLTLYLSSRDLVVSSGGIDRLQGVLLVDPEFVENRKVYGQVTLTFRYGREDEEVMGLKFCNEAIMCLAQLYPPHPGTPDNVTPLQLERPPDRGQRVRRKDHRGTRGNNRPSDDIGKLKRLTVLFTM